MTTKRMSYEDMKDLLIFLDEQLAKENTQMMRYSYENLQFKTLKAIEELLEGLPF